MESFVVWMSNPPKKKLLLVTQPIAVVLLGGGFDIHLKIQPKKFVG